MQEVNQTQDFTLRWQPIADQASIHGRGLDPRAAGGLRGGWCWRRRLRSRLGDLIQLHISGFQQDISGFRQDISGFRQDISGFRQDILASALRRTAWVLEFFHFRLRPTCFAQDIFAVLLYFP